MKARRSNREEHIGPLVIAAEIGLLLWMLFFFYVLMPLILD